MSLAINQLSPVSLAEAEALLIQYLQAEFPSLDFSKGRVLYELLIKPAAIFYTYNETNIDRLKNSLSLVTASANPDNVDSTILDAVLSNMRISRQAGTYATGRLVVILSELVSTAIPRLTIFTANGLEFVPTTSFVGVTSAANVTSTSTRLISARSDGSYAFVIDVVASTATELGNVQQNTRFTMSPMVARIVDVYAESSFTGGTSGDDNTTLIRKASGNLSPKVMCTRLSDTALIKERYPQVSDVSVVGFGDAEMLRDRHNAMNLSTGGKADLYVRTRGIPAIKILTKTCTLVDKTTKTFSCSLDRDEAAGMYIVRAVVPANAELVTTGGTGLRVPLYGTKEITGVTRMLDLTALNDELIPDITSLTEGAFSRFQTMVVRFRDSSLNVTALNVGDTVQYKLYVVYMPQIAEIHDFITQRSVRPTCSDLLVRAPIPCLCSASISLVKLSSTDTIDLEGLKQAISTRVSELTFATGQFPISTIIESIYNELSGRVIVDLPIQLSGLVIYPDDTTAMLMSTDRLMVPDTPGKCTTSRTAAFYLDPADISIAVSVNNNRTV